MTHDELMDVDDDNNPRIHAPGAVLPPPKPPACPYNPTLLPMMTTPPLPRLSLPTTVTAAFPPPRPRPALCPLSLTPCLTSPSTSLRLLSVPQGLLLTLPAPPAPPQLPARLPGVSSTSTVRCQLPPLADQAQTWPVMGTGTLRSTRTAMGRLATSAATP